MQRILIVVLLLLVALLQLRLWGGDGMSRQQELKAAIAEQQAENERLKTRNAALEAEVLNLKEEREAIEERARAELGLIGEDEIFYHVIGDGRRESSAERPENGE